MKLSSLSEARYHGDHFEWKLEKEWRDKGGKFSVAGRGSREDLYLEVIAFAGERSDYVVNGPEDITLGFEDNGLEDHWIVIGEEGSNSCWNCDGEGFRGRSDEECEDCDGTGQTSFGYDNELDDGRYVIGTFTKA